MKDYIVYTVTISGEIVYIGSGKVGREKHCDSGTSHCYELNKCHHTGVQMNVAIYKMYLTKEESLSLEKELILLHQPRFNKVYVNDNRGKKGSSIVRIISDIKKNSINVYGTEFNHKYGDGINEFVKYLCKQGYVFTDGCLIQPLNVAINDLRDNKLALRLFRRLADPRTRDKCISWISVAFDVRVENNKVWIRVKPIYDFKG